MARTLTQPGPERANRLIFTGAVALAAVAAILIFVALSNFGGGGKSKTTAGGSVSVVVASRDIKAGTKISDDMLKVASVSKDSELPGAFADKAALVGLTTRYPVQSQEQLTSAKVGQTADDKVFAAVIPAGKRAVAIPVSETTSVGGLIVAGDHIDITAVINGKGGSQNDSASTLLQDVLVLSVAQTAQTVTTRVDPNGTPIAEGAIANRPDNTSAKPTARSITVAVDPKDVALIALAQEQGKIYLSLRPPGDDAQVQGVDAPRSLPNP